MVSLHDSPRFQSSYFATGTLCKWWHFHHNLMKDWCLGIRQGAVLMGCVVSGYSIIYGKITAGCATLISILTAIPWKTMCEAQTKKWELDRDWLCLGPAQHIPSSDMENWAKFCKSISSWLLLLSFIFSWQMEVCLRPSWSWIRAAECSYLYSKNARLCCEALEDPPHKTCRTSSSVMWQHWKTTDFLCSETF